MDVIELGLTTHGLPYRTAFGYGLPINTAMGGVSCTITTRYDALEGTSIQTLAHFPASALLFEFVI